MDQRDRWLERVTSLRRWSRGDERAPHKPLLLLYALGRLQRSGASAMTYVEAESDLQRLLDEFGPLNRTSPAYPFHHLQSDGLWVVQPSDADPGPSRTKLRSSGAIGQFHRDFEAALLRDPALITMTAHALLEATFPPSLHRDLCSAAGLDIETVDALAERTEVLQPRGRDPKFRQLVLMAYECRCAMCGYDGRLEAGAVGLDAAHLQWRAHGGPDTVENALCLCSFHHKLLDLGVLGITSDHEIAVSAHFVGRGPTASELVLRLVGEPLLEPQPGQPRPAEAHIAWHTRQVFREPARIPAQVEP